MTKDLNKNLMVYRYNYLDLPDEILMASDGLNTISYLYDAPS